MIRFYSVHSGVVHFSWQLPRKITADLAAQTLERMFCLAYENEDLLEDLRLAIDDKELVWLTNKLQVVAAQKEVKIEGKIAFHLLPVILHLLDQEGFVLEEEEKQSSTSSLDKRMMLC